MSPEDLARSQHVLAKAAEAVQQWRGIAAWLDARHAERAAGDRLPRQREESDG